MKIYVIETRDRNDFKKVETIFTFFDIDANKNYKEFVLAFAKNLGLVINKHWVDTIADYQRHNNHLTPEEFKKKSKEFKKFLKEFDFKHYLIKYCGGEVVEHQTAYKHGYI